MREIRQSGSVGGESLTRLPYLNRGTRDRSAGSRHSDTEFRFVTAELDARF